VVSPRGQVAGRSTTYWYVNQHTGCSTAGSHFVVDLSFAYMIVAGLVEGLVMTHNCLEIWRCFRDWRANYLRVDSKGSRRSCWFFFVYVSGEFSLASAILCSSFAQACRGETRGRDIPQNIHPAAVRSWVKCSSLNIFGIGTTTRS